MSKKDEAIFVGPEDGNNLTNPIGGGMVLKVRDEDTAGANSVHDNTIPPGSPGPRPHLHRDHEEAFYVLEGELTVRVGPRTIKAPAGSFVVVPRGVVHQPSNSGADQGVARLLPGGDGQLLRGGGRGAHPAASDARRSGGPGEAGGLHQEVRLRVRRVRAGAIVGSESRVLGPSLLLLFTHLPRRGCSRKKRRG